MPLPINCADCGVRVVIRGKNQKLCKECGFKRKIKGREFFRRRNGR